MATITDTHLDLGEVGTLDAEALTTEVRAAMAPDARDPAAHRARSPRSSGGWRRYLPVDEQGVVVNELVAWLRDHPEVTRVAELAEHVGLSERSLQRLVEQRVGLSPKWLIQRRRLHDAVEALKAGESSLADMAARLGYADQAHFTHDFRTVTGMTPGDYLRDQPRS